jgi:hypothetical protein
MTHKEFYIWLDGFLTNRSWTVIQQTDIESIKDKMKEVKSESEINWDSLRANKKTSPFNPVTIPLGDKGDLGHPPRIVM